MEASAVDLLRVRLATAVLELLARNYACAVSYINDNATKNLQYTLGRLQVQTCIACMR